MTTSPKLAAGEEQLRMLLDNVPARVALLDRERRHCYVNQEYMQFVGRPMEAILGRTVAEITGTEPFAEWRGLGARALAGEAVRWEGWVPRHDTGDPRFVQRFYVPYRGVDGFIDGYFTLTRDLTELKCVEERLIEQVAALHASETLAAAITTAALDCVVVIDEAGLVVVFNPAAQATFGYVEADAVGRPMAELIVPPAHRAAHAAGFQRYLHEGTSRLLGRRIEMEGMRADGSILPVELALTEVKLPGRHLFVANLRDLTAIKRTEAKIRRQREALHQVEKMAAFGSLLAGVAHELNNPLSIVIGHAVLLEEETRDHGLDAVSERAEKIRLAAERCGRTVRAFLAMARQRGRRRERVEIDRLLRFTLKLLDDRPAAEVIDVRWDMPDRLPAVLGDRDELYHVLTNLLVNAQEALRAAPMPHVIELTATVQGAVLEIGVADNGPGVPSAIRGRIFEPFFTTKRPGSGTGIGLAVSKGFAEAHGGSLTLDASRQNGARFVLRLPTEDAAGRTDVESDAVAFPIWSPDSVELSDLFWAPEDLNPKQGNIAKGR
jgi:PAS domain S-box-containing protein